MINRSHLFFLLLMIGCSVHAMSDEIIKKHPNMLIGDDHEILNESDLILPPNRAIDNIPFLGSKDNFDYPYWQCFPRENIALIFEDTGSSPEEMRNADTMADISIKVRVSPDVLHEYVTRRLMPADEFERRLILWRNLLKGEKFACMQGDFEQRKYKMSENGQRLEVFTWTFEKIKTKKGCDSYFDPCDQ